MADTKKSTQPWKAQAKATRRLAAETRQAEHDKLTPREKLKKLDRYGFDAKRERARLQEALRREDK
jgi:hypothetical protein